MRVQFINSTEVKYTNLKDVVSKDDLRPAIQGVYIDFKEKVLVATDAHVLITYPIEITENSLENDDIISGIEGVIVPIDYFNHLRYMVKLPAKNKRVIEPEFILTDDYAEIHWLGEMIYRCKYIDARYPKWNAENIMINPKDYPVKPEAVGVNLHILKRLTSGIPNYNPVQTLRMETTAEHKAIIFTSTNVDYDRPIKAIIMPVKL